MVRYVPPPDPGVRPDNGPLDRMNPQDRVLTARPGNEGKTHMLTAKRVERTRKPGRYRCGLVKGLLLQISANGAKSWVLRYERYGRERMMGLGSASEFSLKEARERARQARQLLADGVDPLASKHAAREAAKLAEQSRVTFAEAARRYLDQNESKWRSAGHREQFLNSLQTFAFPALGSLDIAAIATADVLRILDPIWKTKTETASRVRNRIEAVIDWAVVRGHRPPGANPARWKGHLDQVLPAPRKVAPVVHHAALPYAEVPSFMAKLRTQQGSSARALEFLVLTAARSNEVRGARWSEIDFDSKTWIVPGHKMKSGREHRQPLSEPALDLLRALPREAGNDHLFIGGRVGSGLTNMSLFLLMGRMDQSGVATTHGFRSAFSTWSHERTSHSTHTIELSLAHSVGTETERAYRRTDMIEKRRQLMEAWARFCLMSKAGGDVVALRGGR
jgi:integrase